MTKAEIFMLESNTIEGEKRINPGDVKAYELAESGILTINDIFHIHNALGEHLNAKWVGKFRNIDVRVGEYMCPHWREIPELMRKFISKLSSLDSWEAHNEFQKIHPFQDLNGRTGRLIWISKVINEGYSGKIPFLQMYYYQTLNHL